MTTQLPDFNAMWNYGNPSQTRAKFLEVAEQTADQPDLSYALQLQTQIARTYSLEANFDEAHQVLDKVKTKLTDETPVARVRYLLERGRTYNSAKEKQMAKDLFEQAYQKSKAIGADTFTIDAAHMVAIAVGSLEEKLQWNQNGLQEAQQSTDEKVKRWIGVFHNNMGWDLFEAERYSDALEHFQSCWNFHEERQNDDGLSIAKWSYAKTLRLLDRIDESLKMQLELLQEKDGEDKSGYGYEELGELYLLKNDKEQSSQYFAKSYAVLSQDVWLQKYEKARLDRLKDLSNPG